MTMNIPKARKILTIYEQIAKVQQTEVKPRLKFGVLLGNAAAFNPVSGDITLNKGTWFITRFTKRKILAHELKHSDQFTQIARYFAGISENVETGLENFKKFLIDMDPMYENFMENFNQKFYKKAIQKKGVIKEGHPLFERVKAYLETAKDMYKKSLVYYLEEYEKGGSKAVRKYAQEQHLKYKECLFEKEANEAAAEIKKKLKADRT